MVDKLRNQIGSLRDALSDEFISIGDAFVMDDFRTLVLVH